MQKIFLKVYSNEYRNLCPSKTFKKYIYFYLCIYLAVLGPSCGMPDLQLQACGIQFPDQGLNLGPLHWEHRILATGPQESPCPSKTLQEGSVRCGEGDGTPLQYSCLENPLIGGACWAAVHGVAKSWTRPSDFTFTFHFHALEKEMATHSSVVAWRIPGTGEPGGLSSMGLHRVGHD